MVPFYRKGLFLNPPIVVEAINFFCLHYILGYKTCFLLPSNVSHSSHMQHGPDFTFSLLQFEFKKIFINMHF
jgi:hypothetical protein